MAKEALRVGKWQIYILYVVILFNVKMAFAPRYFAVFLDKDAWLAMILAGLVSVLGQLTYYGLCKHYPDQNVMEFSQVVWGKWLGLLAIIGSFIYLVLAIGVSLRAFGDGIKFILLDKTPLIVVMSAMLLVMAYLVLQGLGTIIKVYEWVFPISLGATLLTLLLPILRANFSNLFPLLPTDWGNFLIHAPIALQSYVGIGILGFLVCRSQDKKLGLPIVAGVLTVCVLKTLLIVVLSCFFVPAELKHIMYPLVDMAKGIELRSVLLERSETYFVLAWIPITFTSLVSFLYMANESIIYIFPKVNRLLSIAVILVLVIYISLWAQMDTQNIQYYRYVEWVGVLIAFVFTPITYFVSLLKKRWQHGQ